MLFESTGDLRAARSLISKRERSGPGRDPRACASRFAGLGARASHSRNHCCSPGRPISVLPSLSRAVE